MCSVVEFKKMPSPSTNLSIDFSFLFGLAKMLTANAVLMSMYTINYKNRNVRKC